MHSAIAGMTMQGKTTLAKIVHDGLVKRGRQTAMLDPMNEGKIISPNFTTRKLREYLRHIRVTKNLYCFVDESRTAISKSDASAIILTSSIRHLGHNSMMICHSMIDLNPTLRENFSDIYLFRCGPRTAEVVAEGWAEKRAFDAVSLKVGEFLLISKVKPLRKGKINFMKMSVSIDNLS
jgi:hypothetical protein